MGDYDDDDDMPQIQGAHNDAAEEAPSGALPPTTETVTDEPTEEGASTDAPPETSPMDMVTDTLSGTDATTLLKIANQYGVGHDDPLWSAVLILLGSQKAAKETVEAAAKLETAGTDLGAKIFDQTTKAGNELKTALMDAATKTGTAFVQKITAGIVAAIDKPVTKGVQQITEAAGGLDAAAQAQRAAILAEWRKDLASAAAAEAKRRGSLAAASSWVAVLVTCIIFLAGGAVITHEYEVYSQHLLPSGYTLRYNQNGTPDCGAIGRFGQVCGVNK